MNFELQYAALGAVRSRMQGTGGDLADCAKRLRRQMEALNGQSGFGIETVRSRIGSSASSVSTQSGNAYVTAAFLSDLERVVTDQENKAYSVLSEAIPTEMKLTDALVAWTPGNTLSLWWEKLIASYPKVLPFLTAIGCFADWVSEIFGGENENGPINTSDNTRNYDGWGKAAGTIRAIEYAFLAKWCTDAAKCDTKNDMITSMCNALDNLPEDHPLHGINRNQLTAIKESNGLEGMIIRLDQENAIVIFAGTDDAADGYADGVNVFLSGAPGAPLINAVEGVTGLFYENQWESANRIIGELGADNIMLAGHSLGGNIAADVATNHSNVSECLTFDAPGRADALWKSFTASGQVDKITNYTIKGSSVSWVGDQIGTEVSLDVKGANWDEPFFKHAMKGIIDALGGAKAISRP